MTKLSDRGVGDRDDRLAATPLHEVGERRFERGGLPMGVGQAFVGSRYES